MEMGHIAGITDVGITARSVSGNYKTTVRDYLSVSGRPVRAVLDIPNLTDRNIVTVHHIPTDMGQRSLFFNQIATAGYAMLQWDTLNHDTSVFIDRLSLGGLNRIEDHLKSQIMGEELDLPVQFFTQCLWAMNVQAGRTTQKTKGRDHADKSETMVSMKVSDKDMTQFRKADTALTQLHLRAFGTVKHQHLITHLHHLRRSVMTKGGKCTSTPKDMYLEWLHLFSTRSY